MTKRELMEALQLHTIYRWQIVEVMRPQSVAEHSYRVWMLLQHLYDSMNLNGHNSLERESIGRFSMLHDCVELVTGDIPSTVKEALEKVAPGVVTKYEMVVLEKNFPTIASTLRGMQNTMGWYLLKIADCVEAVLYMQQYGIWKDGARGCKNVVIGNRLEALEAIFKHVEAKFRSEDWRRARAWVEDITRCDLQRTARLAEPAESSPVAKLPG